MYRLIARCHMTVKLMHRKITFAKNGTLIFTADMYDENNVKLSKFCTINQNLIKFAVEHPEKIEYIDNMFLYEKQLDGFYLRIDKHGKPIIKDGHAVMIDSVRIWQKKVFDTDTGEMEWVENPEFLIARLLNRCYIPVELKQKDWA